jgi:hypothetical protein
MRNVPASAFAPPSIASVEAIEDLDADARRRVIAAAERARRAPTSSLLAALGVFWASLVVIDGGHVSMSSTRSLTGVTFVLAAGFVVVGFVRRRANLRRACRRAGLDDAATRRVMRAWVR